MRSNNNIFFQLQCRHDSWLVWWNCTRGKILLDDWVMIH